MNNLYLPFRANPSLPALPTLNAKPKQWWDNDNYWNGRQRPTTPKPTESFAPNEPQPSPKPRQGQRPTTPSPTPTQPTAPKPKPAETIANPTGNVYQTNIPQGSLGNQAYYRDAAQTYAGISQQGNGWAKYQDGSFVDYTSLAWKKAEAFKPTDPEAIKLWAAIPDSWKADMARWGADYVNAWLMAQSKGAQQGMFQGQMMSGFEAAAKISEMAGQARENAKRQQQQADYDFDMKTKDLDVNKQPLYVPSPYI